ncbi:hypothetical protein NFHSH190041_06540 [Shewanella sp. NFH-SH190041]|nr:hypothetical protein NFHSH190041_06540 [Shewanella sp. NFH-SH190041]
MAFEIALDMAFDKTLAITFWCVLTSNNNVTRHASNSLLCSALNEIKVDISSVISTSLALKRTLNILGSVDVS